MATRKSDRRRRRHDEPRGDHPRELTLDKHSRKLLERIAVALEAIADATSVDTSALEARLGGLESATASLKDAVDKNQPKG